jgi:prephenate dehydrogenase
MVEELKTKAVCIVGLGLMGGSLGLALRGKCRTVTGVARREETLARAVAMGAIDAGAIDPLVAVAEADVVVLATPVRTILALIPLLAPAMRPGALLTDLGSTKLDVVAALDRVAGGIQVCGGHPLCGRELSGLSAAQPDLYQDKCYVVAPGQRTSPQAVTLVEEMARAAGSRPAVMDAAAHDRLVAVISHLPYLQAAALAAVAGRQAAGDHRAWQLAASGFRDTARLAASDADMMLDILMTNRANLAGLARQAAGWLSDLALALDANDETSAAQALSLARDAIMDYRRVKRSDPLPNSPVPSSPAACRADEEMSHTR